jgi:hypothetical protein
MGKVDNADRVLFAILGILCGLTVPIVFLFLTGLLIPPAFPVLSAFGGFLGFRYAQQISDWSFRE